MGVDLRSDTVTKPSAGMLDAMMSAEVGDDCYREDPTVNALELEAAKLLGKEASLFVPSGTMANQIALMLHCRSGDEAVVSGGAHLFYYEGGSAAAFAGVQAAVAGPTGPFTASQAEAVIKGDAYYLPETSVICVENTHNRGGGKVWPLSDLDAIASLAKEQGIGVHLDGARVWNAAVADGVPVSRICQTADTVSACFSKGLGAPVGSVVAGTKEHIERALRLRRRFGGALRQAGFLCAAALYGLKHHLPELHHDHRRARHLGHELLNFGVSVVPVETNIVNFDVREIGEGHASEFVQRWQDKGVLASAIGPTRIRVVTHRDLSDADIERAVATAKEVIDEIR